MTKDTPGTVEARLVSAAVEIMCNGLCAEQPVFPPYCGASDHWKAALAKIAADVLALASPPVWQPIETAPKDDARVEEILAPYRQLIRSSPDLMSLLYDADMLPEQIVSVRGAISVAAVCEAYKLAPPATGGEL